MSICEHKRSEMNIVSIREQLQKCMIKYNFICTYVTYKRFTLENLNLKQPNLTEQTIKK